jgi:hypothetical protein
VAWQAQRLGIDMDLPAQHPSTRWRCCVWAWPVRRRPDCRTGAWWSC